jgi:hypothetical protein
MRVLPFIAMAVMTLSCTVLLVRGLRTRKAVMGVNLVAERDRNPVRYWIVQSTYASAIACFGSGIWLAATGHAVEGGLLVDKLIMSTWGLSFLGVAAGAGTIFSIGLQTGVADSRFGDIKRAKAPVRYWAMEMLYVLATCLTTLLGLGIFVLVFLK